MKPVVIVDATGLLCPLPILKLRKALSNIEVGQSVELLTDDAAALIDVPHFCAEAKHILAAQHNDDMPYSFQIIRNL